jgi:histidinol-phosphate phosphatase family protein
MEAKAVFLDRDGVISTYPGDFLYVTSLQQFIILPGVAEAIRKLHTHGYLVFVVSNQAGVGKGLYPQSALDSITRIMTETLDAQGAPIRKVYYCTHTPEAQCSCRKPKTGMVEAAIDQMRGEGLEIDKQKSYFVGDTMRDITTGHASGLKTILVFSGKEKPENRPEWTETPDFLARDLSDAADIIVRRT